MKNVMIYRMLVLLLLCLGTTAYGQNVVDDNVERAALQAIFDETNHTSWNLPQSVMWTQEQIDNYPTTRPYGIGYSNGDIYSISLTCNLSGSLPDEINNLTQLTNLYVYGNALTGSLPNLANLVNIRTLNLGNNDFSGSLPAWLANLTLATDIVLSSKPATSGVRLSGTLPSGISALTQLNHLDLDYNDLSAAMAIPNSFASLSNLTFLELRGCLLQPGSVSTGLTALAKLTTIDLSENSGLVVSNELAGILNNIPTLRNVSLHNMGGNLLSLPTSFTSMGITSVLLDYNTNFADPAKLAQIVADMATMPSLNQLSLQYCNLKTVSSNFDDLEELTYLVLSHNPLVPNDLDELGEMVALKELLVEYCNLQKVPSALTNLATLEHIDASNNSLYLFPNDSLKFIPALKTLDIGFNGIAALPDWFGTVYMSSITKLTLDNNSLDSLNNNFELMVNLEFLSIGANGLKQLPDYLPSFVDLKTLRLYNNQLKTLPDLSTLVDLESIELQQNLLSGSIPAYLTDYTSNKKLVNISYNNYTAADANASFTTEPTVLYVHENGLTFKQVLKLDPNGYTNHSNYVYSPQDSVDVKKEVYGFIGGNVKLTAAIDTAITTPYACTYQWYKIVPNGAPLSVAGPTTAKVVYVPITINDQGAQFFYTIRNSGDPNLTLISRIQTLVITCDVLPEAVGFSTKKYLCAMNFIPTASYPSGCRTKSYQWNFGDGKTAVDKSPFHAYNQGGTYTVTLKLQYSCGICVRDTVITKQVVYNPTEDVLEDSLITVSTDVKTRVINTSAATFADAWPLLHQTNTNLDNPYESASEGVWRNEGVYVYDVPRDISENTDIRKDGTYRLENFNWEYAEFGAIPDWTKTNTMTQYSPFGFELENQDVLGIYSSALYDYGGQLATATGVNMRNKEMAFTSFEYSGDRITGNWVFGTQQIPDYYIYDVHLGRKNIAIVKASMAELADAEKVDVTSRSLFYSPFSSLYRRSNFIKDDEIICRQVYPENPEWTMLVLRKSPAQLLWRGKIKVTNQLSPIVTPDIDATIAHSGKKSLRVNMQKTFKQEFLQLDSAKRYFFSGWVSVNNPYVTEQSLGANLGIDVVFRDKNGNVLSTTSLVPAGTIIEGWQQIKGAIICPARYAHMELTFKPGSGAAWYDDIRFHPENGNMKSFVYDTNDYRLQSILDEENFASYYFYDQEGNLYLTQKETAEGVKTISENISYIKKN